MQTYLPGRPEPSEYVKYFNTYIKLVPEEEIFEALGAQLAQLRSVLDGLTPEQYDVLHEPYTWTIRQVIGHCIDTERVFGYRGARFAADDQTSLPGFDQDLFVANTDYSNVPLSHLVDELESLRQGNIAMLKRMEPDCWTRLGTADGKKMSLRAVAYILVGHIRHHAAIIKKRLNK